MWSEPAVVCVAVIGMNALLGDFVAAFGSVTFPEAADPPGRCNAASRISTQHTATNTSLNMFVRLRLCVLFMACSFSGVSVTNLRERISSPDLLSFGRQNQTFIQIRRREGVSANASRTIHHKDDLIVKSARRSPYLTAFANQVLR